MQRLFRMRSLHPRLYCKDQSTRSKDKFTYSKLNIYSNKIFKGNYFNELDNKVSLLLAEKQINWIEKNQFGIQLDKRIRGMWSANWKKFISKPI